MWNIPVFWCGCLNWHFKNWHYVGDINWQSVLKGAARLRCRAVRQTFVSIACVGSAADPHGSLWLIWRLACSKIQRHSCDKLATSRHTRNLHISSGELPTSQSMRQSYSLSIRHRLSVCELSIDRPPTVFKSAPRGIHDSQTPLATKWVVMCGQLRALLPDKCFFFILLCPRLPRITKVSQSCATFQCDL